MPGLALIANALLILLLIAGVWLQPWNDEAPADKTWHQPELLVEQFSEPISPARWAFDITLAEQQLGAFLQAGGARLTRSGQTMSAEPWSELEVGPALAQQLEEAARTLPPHLSEADLDRAGVLLKKSFPGAAGAQLSQLLPAMYRYQRARQQALADPLDGQQASGVDAAEAAFERSRALQQSFFGSHADALFRRQNALSQYLLQRRRLRADASLSEAGKRSALEQLRQSYEAQQ